MVGRPSEVRLELCVCKYYISYKGTHLRVLVKLRHGETRRACLKNASLYLHERTKCNFPSVHPLLLTAPIEPGGAPRISASGRRFRSHISIALVVHTVQLHSWHIQLSQLCHALHLSSC